MRSAAPVTQNHLSKSTYLMLQNATHLRKSAPWPPNISDEHVFYCACHAKSIFEDLLQMSHACHRFWKCYKTITFCSLLPRCTIPCACHAKRRLNLQKWSEPLVFLTFWLGNLLRGPKLVCFVHFHFEMCFAPQRRHFFDISTSKSGPKLVCFVHFDLEMCFAPQRRALFRHLYFQKWSERGVFCTFWLGNVLCATTACNFSSLLWPAGFAPASHKLLEKQSVSRLSYLFAHLHLLSSDSFSSLTFSLLIFLFSLPLPCSAFHLSILSEVWLLNVLQQYIYI